MSTQEEHLEKPLTKIPSKKGITSHEENKVPHEAELAKEKTDKEAPVKQNLNDNVVISLHNSFAALSYVSEVPLGEVSLVDLENNVQAKTIVSHAQMQVNTIPIEGTCLVSVSSSEAPISFEARPSTTGYLETGKIMESGFGLKSPSTSISQGNISGRQSFPRVTIVSPEQALDPFLPEVRAYDQEQTHTPMPTPVTTTGGLWSLDKRPISMSSMPHTTNANIQQSVKIMKKFWGDESEDDVVSDSSLNLDSSPNKYMLIGPSPVSNTKQSKRKNKKKSPRNIDIAILEGIKTRAQKNNKKNTTSMKIQYWGSG